MGFRLFKLKIGLGIFVIFGTLTIALIGCGKFWGGLNFQCQSYVSEVLKDNPVGYWRLNETSGTTAFDSGSLANNLTYTTLFTLGQPGPVFYDPQSLGVLTSGNPSISQNAVSLNVTTNVLTLEGWALRTNANGFVMIQRGVAAASGYTFGLGVVPCTANQIKYSKFGVVDTCGGNVPTDTNWHHIVGVASATGVVVYIDGVGTQTSVNNTNFITSAANFVIAGNLGGSINDFSEVAVYFAALTPDRIAAHYLKGSSCVHPSSN